MPRQSKPGPMFDAVPGAKTATSPNLLFFLAQAGQDRVVLEALDVGLPLELRGRREDPALLQDRIDAAHRFFSSRGILKGATSGCRSSSVSPWRSRTRNSSRPRSR